VNYSTKNILIYRLLHCKLVAKFSETGYVQDLPPQGRPRVNDETRLDVLLKGEENPHHSTRHLVLNNNVDHSFVVKLLRCYEDPNFFSILFSDEATFLPEWDSTSSQLHVLVLNKRKSSLDSRLAQSTLKEIKCLDWNNRTAFNRALPF
jgi:hypothetical protein